MSITAEREKVIDFTAAYSPFFQAVFAAKNVSLKSAAELAGNSALARNMRELSVLTCLMIFLYDAPTSESCRADEHSQIIEAIAKRDAARAPTVPPAE